MNVVEAPDEKTIARVSLELGSRGTGKYETLVAIPIDDFIGSSSGTSVRGFVSSVAQRCWRRLRVLASHHPRRLSCDRTYAEAQ